MHPCHGFHELSVQLISVFSILQFASSGFGPRRPMMFRDSVGTPTTAAEILRATKLPRRNSTRAHSCSVAVSILMSPFRFAALRHEAGDRHRPSGQPAGHVYSHFLRLCSETVERNRCRLGIQYDEEFVMTVFFEASGSIMDLPPK